MTRGAHSISASSFNPFSNDNELRTKKNDHFYFYAMCPVSGSFGGKGGGFA